MALVQAGLVHHTQHSEHITATALAQATDPEQAGVERAC